MNQSKPPSIQLTQAGYDKAKSDFQRLTKEREEILVRLQAAREMGDLSENGAYKYAKLELRDTDRQLRRLTNLIRNGEVIKSNKSGFINFGNTVTLSHQGKDVTFTLVSRHESNPAQKMLSDESPLGQAVFGKKVGDTVIVSAPAGETTYTIKSVK